MKKDDEDAAVLLIYIIARFPKPYLNDGMLFCYFIVCGLFLVIIVKIVKQSRSIFISFKPSDFLKKATSFSIQSNRNRSL